MNNNQFDDLKQFIDSRISQSELHFDEKLNELKKEMLDGFSGIGEVIDDIHSLLDETKNEFNKRLTKLEQESAT